MESTQSKLYEIEDSAGRKTDVYNVADVDNIDYNNENQKLRIEMSKFLMLTNVQLIDEEDNKNMEPDYGDQFEDKK